MGKKRVLVGYGIDVDAVANHINTTVGGKPNLANVSRGTSNNAGRDSSAVIDFAQACSAQHAASNAYSISGKNTESNAHGIYPAIP